MPLKESKVDEGQVRGGGVPRKTSDLASIGSFARPIEMQVRACWLYL